MADIKALDGEKALFQLAAVTLPSGAQAQAIVLVGADGNAIASWPLPAGAATESSLASILAKLSADPATQTTLAAILAKLNASLAVTGTFWQATQPVSAAALPLPSGAATQTTLASVLSELQGVLDVAVQAFPSDYPDAASLAKLEQVRALLAGTLVVSGPLTDTQLRATPIPNANVDDSFLVRWVLKPLARLTFTTLGLRIDCGGSSVSASIAANQDLRSVTGTVSGLGYNSQLGQAMQQSNHAFQNGFRRNLVVS